MENLETVLQCLSDFGRATEKKIAPELDDLLTHIAKTGRTEFPWHLLKPLIAYKLEKVLEEFFENNSSANLFLSEPTSKTKDFYPDAKKLISNLNSFTGTPFTIQRICELLTEPKKYYKTKDKFLRGVEKNVMVVSTVEPNGSLITRLTVSGVLTNGSLSPSKTTELPSAQGSTSLASTYNSPLNTVTLESTPNSTDFAQENSAEETSWTPRTEKNSSETDTQINGTKDTESSKEVCAVTGGARSPDSGEVHQGVTSAVTADEGASVENETPEEEIPNVDEKRVEQTPTDEKPTSQEEKMEESSQL